jgi:hypothetical protein
MNRKQYIDHLNNIKNESIEDIKNREALFITSEDLIKYFGPNFKKKIIKYSELKNYQNIEQLLKNNDYKIILIEQEINTGHWTCILRYNKTLEWFNSYGLQPSIDLNYNADDKNEMLGQGIKYLNILLNEAQNRYNIIYNKKKLQSSESNIATCGRWCILRILMFKFFKFNLEQFLKFIEAMKLKYGVSSDYIVTMLII